MMKTFPILAAGAALLAAAACSSSGNSGPATPDEFRVVTKPPLSTPPNYSLRPPAPGTTIPAEVEGTGSVSAFGTVIGAGASPGERALVAAAGANAVNPAVRAQVDYEETRAIRKPASVADRVLFWRGDNLEDAESAMTDNATGNQPVTVQQTSGGRRIKLPGT